MQEYGRIRLVPWEREILLPVLSFPADFISKNTIIDSTTCAPPHGRDMLESGLLSVYHSRIKDHGQIDLQISMLHLLAS